MLIAVLMGAWLGFIASRKGRKWYIWAAVGLAVSFALNVAVFLPFDNFMGGREYDSDLDAYAALILCILNIAAGLVISSRMRPVRDDRPAAARRGTPRDFSGVRGDSPGPSGPEGDVVPEAALDSGPLAAPVAEGRSEASALRRSIRKRALKRALKFRKVAARREEELRRRMRDEALEDLGPLGRKARRILSRL